MTTTPDPAPAPATPPKLVATDLDGTLLRSDGTLSGRTAAALAAAEAAGIRLALVTGRPPRGLPALHRDIGRHFAVTANGAAVYAPDGTPVRLSPFPAAPWPRSWRGCARRCRVCPSPSSTRRSSATNRRTPPGRTGSPRSN